MRFPIRERVLKFSPLLISVFFLLLLVTTTPLYLSETKNTGLEKNKTKVVGEIEKDSESNQNSVKVNVEDSVKGTSDSNSSKQTGTCTVTKNGITETIPSDQVKVDENSNGDISVKVECNNSINSTQESGQNKTSVKNNIKVNVNSSN